MRMCAYCSRPAVQLSPCAPSSCSIALPVHAAPVGQPLAWDFFSCFYLIILCYVMFYYVLMLALAYVPGCDCPCLLAQPCCVSCAGKLCMSMQHLWLSLLSSMLQAEGKGTGRTMLQRPQSLCIAVLMDDIRARS